MAAAAETPGRTASAIIKRTLPILDWLPGYQNHWLRGDVVAALTLWALLVPEAMAYAGIAGMPPETGLYAAPLALAGYAILGTSKHLDVGPSSAVAALSFSVIASLGVVIGGPEFIVLTIALALMVGIYLIIGGILRLGVLADFLSRPVLDGFVVGVAISIAVGQLDKLLGYEAAGDYDFVPEIFLLLSDIDMTHLPTLAIGLVSLALLFILRRYTPKLPAALIVLFLSIIASTLFNFENAGIHIVGNIPAGLPDFGFPEGFGLDDLVTVSGGAVGVALVAFAESVAIARSVAIRHGYEIDVNKELIAVGAANMGSSFSGAFVVDGSMSRTAAADGAGANSQMVSLIAAVTILITAVALTPLFHNLPEATLGAIVIHAVWHNINFKKVQQYRRLTRLDYVTAVVALIGVLALGLIEGLVIAVLLGLITLLFGTKHHRTHVLGRVPDTTHYRSTEHYPDAETYPGLLIIRFDGTLFFANAHDFVTDVRRQIATADPSPLVVLLDGESMIEIDATAVITLKELNEELKKNGIQVWLARFKTNVLMVIRNASFDQTIPPERFYSSIHDAVSDFLAQEFDQRTEGFIAGR